MRLESLIGTRLGRYAITNLLGRGGMAAVFQADDHVLRRPVALKILYSQFLSDPTLVERFRSEAIIAARLEHPNIVPIYDVGEAEGLVYIAMKLLPGRSLQDVLQMEHAAMASDRVVDLVSQVAAALDYAHARGVVHRDIKPGNVMVLDDGKVVLNDFGIAKSLDAPGMTGTGVLIGTPDYMAPEQINPKQGQLDGRADIYALGVMTYRMLTGERPFDGSTTEVMMAHLSQAPPAASERNPRLAPAVDAVLSQAMAKQPADRYQSAGLFARALSEAAGASTAIGEATPPPGAKRSGGAAVIPAIAAQRIAAANAPTDYSPAEQAAARREAAQRKQRPVWPIFVLVAAIIGLVLASSVAGVLGFRGSNSVGLTARAQTNVAVGLTTTSYVAQAETELAALATPTDQPTPSPAPTSPATAALTSTATLTPAANLTPAPATQAALLPPTRGAVPPPPASAPLPTKTPLPAPTPAPPTATPVPPTLEPAPPTPTPCAIRLEGGFALLWQSEPTVAATLGCAAASAVVGDASLQYFERGQMLWWAATDTIYVLYGDTTGSFERYANPRNPEYDTERETNVPTGRYEPIRGFGTLWQTKPAIREAMGWGTSPEYAIGEPQPAVLQRFEHGYLFFAPELGLGPDPARIWVLTDSATWTRYRDRNR